MITSKLKSKINKSLTWLQSEFGFELMIGAEIEFYLENFTEEKFLKLKKDLKKYDFEKETGKNQFEIRFSFSNNINQIIKEIIDFRLNLIKAAPKYEMKALFEGKPYDLEPGSSIHFHISCYKNNQNIFAKNDNKESIYLLYAIGGLCETMLENMIYFIPNEEGYKRLKAKTNAPTKISWGGNNRTTAIRIPTSDDQNKRIEHRVSSADADPASVIAAILEGIDYGISNKIIPKEKIFGDASDDIYELKKLPSSLEEAITLNKNGGRY